MTTRPFVFSTARQPSRGLWLGLFAGISLISATSARAQVGYQPMGAPPPPGPAASMPSAYQQQGSLLPPAGAGLQNYGQQPRYQAPVNYGGTTSSRHGSTARSSRTASQPAPYQPAAMAPAYQQQPAYPQQRQSGGYQPMTPSYQGPVYQQAPVQQHYQPQPQMPSYSGYGQPKAYPQAPKTKTPLQPLNGGTRPVKKPSSVNAYQQQPATYHPQQPESGGMHNQVAALRANDRTQDRRLDDLERHAFPAARGSNTSSTGYHQVAVGESLSTIAARYGTSVDELKRLNHRSSNVVFAGENLVVPGRGGKGSYTPATPSYSKQGSSSSSGTHIVQRGESLSQIASAYRVSMKSLQDANGIRNANLITPGQRLKIPGRSTNSNTVVVNAPSRPKAKTSSSSKQYISTSYKPSTPARETVLVAPSRVPAAGTGVGHAITPTGPRGVTSYRIEHGDTMDSVAQTFSTTPGEIQRMNKLQATALPAPGEEIVVPQPTSVSL